jgi:hypothetical protein
LALAGATIASAATPAARNTLVIMKFSSSHDTTDREARRSFVLSAALTLLAH